MNTLCEVEKGVGGREGGEWSYSSTAECKNPPDEPFSTDGDRRRKLSGGGGGELARPLRTPLDVLISSK